MKAVQFNTAAMEGGLDKSLRLNASAATPTPGKDQVLVKVVTAAINPVDYKLAELPLINRLIFRGPATPGLDFAGEVASLGPSSNDTQNLQPGQRVFGMLAGPGGVRGSLAEYTIADKNGCVPIPDGVTFDQAAGMGAVGQTAYQSIAPYVHADSGESIFINGGSGGTGTMGIQIAKALGCHVTTTCSTRNVDLCKSLGADEVIDYSAQSVVTALRKLGTHRQYSLIVDNVGSSNEIFPVCHDFTRPDATYIQVGASMSLSGFFAIAKAMLLPSLFGGGSRKYQFLALESKAETLTRLGQWMKEGKVKVPIEATYDLEDGGKAYEQLKSGRTRGKLLIRVS